MGRENLSDGDRDVQDLAVDGEVTAEGAYNTAQGGPWGCLEGYYGGVDGLELDLWGLLYSYKTYYSYH